MYEWRLSREGDIFWGTEEESRGGDLATFPHFRLLAIYYWQRRKWLRGTKKDKIMNSKKYKVAITETAAKTAAKQNGGAAARFWGVIVIDKDSGEKRTAADMLAAAAYIRRGLAVHAHFAGYFAARRGGIV